MNFINYLYSDRKSGIYWISIFGFVLFLSVFNFIMNGEEKDAVLILFFVPILTLLVIYLGFYLSGFRMFQKQRKYRRWIESEMRAGSFITKKVEVFLNSYSLKPPMQNYDAPINIKPKTVTFDVLETKDSILILGYVFDFGIFKRHITPLVISENKNKEFLKKGAVLIERFKMEKQNNQISIKFEKPYKGIKKMIF